MKLRQLVYISTATRPIDEDELADILAVARQNNAERGISGLLLYHEGSFIQALEGPAPAVEKLFEKIETDDRHCETRVLFRGDVEEPSFEGWSMGYLPASRLDEVPEGFHPFLINGFRRRVRGDQDTARKALLAFKEGRWRGSVRTA